MSQSQIGYRYSAALFVCGCLFLGFVSAQPDEPKTPAKLFILPAVLKEARSPKDVKELRDIETHVQKVLDKVMPAVVGVRVGLGAGSGVIVKEDGTLLTAGHVSGNPNQPAAVILPGGKLHKGKTLGKNGSIDSGMMKIIEEGKYQFLDMGKSSDLKVGDWVIAIGHPGGFRINRTPVVRVGRVLFANALVIRTDCVLVGGDSGGPLFDMQGRVVGIHSRIGDKSVTENMHVPIDTYVQTWDRLARGESWSNEGKVVYEKRDALSKDDPTDASPKVPTEKSHVKTYSFRMKTGSTYTIDLVSAEPIVNKLNVFDMFLRLQHPDGTQIAQDDDGGGFPNARIVFKALKDADYKIIATTFPPNQTGKFTLRITEAPFKDAIVAGKVEVLKAVKIPAPSVAPLLEQFKLARVRPHINAVLIDEKGNPLAGKEITLIWEKGTETLKTNAEGVLRWPLQQDKARRLTAQLPEGCRALLALTDQRGTSLGLGFGDSDQSAEKVKSAGGPIVKTIDGELAKTDPFDAERERCFRHVHDFKMSAGKTYTLDLVSDDFDAYLRVEKDDQGKLAEDDDSAGFLNSRIVFTPTAAGVYRLVITTCDPGQFGAYRLTIRETNAKKAPTKLEK